MRVVCCVANTRNDHVAIILIVTSVIIIVIPNYHHYHHYHYFMIIIIIIIIKCILLLSILSFFSLLPSLSVSFIINRGIYTAALDPAHLDQVPAPRLTVVASREPSLLGRRHVHAAAAQQQVARHPRGAAAVTVAARCSSHAIRYSLRYSNGKV